ncbi:heparinase II/III family protein [Microbacterium radiodurans]|uniref:heparinase II/III family protein n=1 Tax=Microbacterium radiodurans TaxID=661398 RepID=UPI001CC37C4F|nr:heparinase II/III family protein [Microbacterium radiodurans]
MKWNAREFAGPLAEACADAPAELRAAGSALPVPPASDRDFWAGLDAATLAPIVAAARADARTPWPQTLASAAARVHGDGDRDGYEQQVFARQRRLSRAVVAAAATCDDDLLDEVADGVWMLAEQSTWSWPAHDDVRERSGAVLADVAAPYLDLGAGEVVGQLAWIDHVLGDRLDERYPGLRARVRHEAEVRVFSPFLDRRDWHWIGLDGHVHNWNPWIHGNVLVAALALQDDPARRERIVALAAAGIDRYIAALPADGAIDEGYAYWWNGACRALEALDVLAFATGGAWDAVAAVPALRETVAFPHRSHLGGPWYVNLADGPARPPADQPWHALHRAARAVGDDDARRHAASHRVPGAPAATEDAGLGRLLRALADPAWLASDAETSPPDSWMPRDVWLPSTQVLVARPAAGSASGLTVVVKGGHNDENHNHNDVGSVIVASDGVPVVVDAGRPTYTKQTFGPRRYDIWTMQSSWHSVPEIGGVPQGVGRTFAAADVETAADGRAASFGLELARAYPAGAAASWHRSVRLDRPDGETGASVTIDDRWRDAAPGTTVRLLLAGDVATEPGRARIVPVAAAAPVVIRWPESARHTLAVRELDDPMLSGVWGERLMRLDIHVDDRDELRVTIEQEPNEDVPS